MPTEAGSWVGGVEGGKAEGLAAGLGACNGGGCSGGGCRAVARSRTKRTSRSCSSFFCRVCNWPRSVACVFVQRARGR